MKTGVFFHPLFALKYWPIMGNKFIKFPEAMQKALKSENVILFEPKKIEREILMKVHRSQVLDGIKGKPYEQGAYLSVGGCVEAAEKVYRGELKNAFVFNVSAGHHASH